jgi:hypothetical protein
MIRSTILWLSTGTIGVVLGWSWQASANDCYVPRDEGGAYLYSFTQVTLETEEGTVVVTDWQDPRLPLPADLRAYLPSERELDQMEPPYQLSFQGGEETDSIQLLVE